MSKDLGISVIVPAYNAASCIGDCIESILDLSAAMHCQIIVVDDGSTDDTALICKRYAERGVELLQIQNGGPSRARNVGIEAATLDYIAFVDADDKIDKNISQLVKIAEAHDADIVCGSISDDLAKLGSGSQSVSIMSPREAIEEGLYQRGINVSACGKVFRRQLFDDEKFIEGMRYEDLEIFCRIFSKANKIAVCDQVLYYYRPNSESFINSYSPARFDAIKATDLIIKQCEDDKLLSKAARDRSFAANFNMYLLAAQWLPQHPQIKPIQDKCWCQIKAYRSEVLGNGKSRLKNRVGALATYGGPSFVKFVNRVFKIV